MFSRATQSSLRYAGRRLQSSNAFRPRRRPNPNYRPIKPGSPGKVVEDFAPAWDASDVIERDLGIEASHAIRHQMRVNRLGGEPTAEEYLQMADYMTAEPGTLEEKLGERRALALDPWDDDEDRETFLQKVDELVEEVRIEDLNLGAHDYDDDDKGLTPRQKAVREINDYIADLEEDVDEEGDPIDPLRLAHGEWADYIVRVDRVQKVQRGGTLVRYRALVVGGNANGCAGFAVAKANSAQEACAIASKRCKRNIFFVDRYKGGGLTRDLVGRHNSCKVTLRAVQPHFGMNGHPLVMDILMHFGISDCSCKTHGNRNHHNVVRATFKALATHESIEDISLKRGKRLMNLERYRRLQI